MENILNLGPKKIVLNEVSMGGQVIKTEHNVIPLSEASLNRMMEHGKTGMIIISSQRSAIDSDNPRLSLRNEFEFDTQDRQLGGIDSDAVYDLEQEWLKERNARADKQLRNDIQAAGYTYTPVYGGYHGKDSVSDEYEPSYVVYNYKRGDDAPGEVYDLVKFGCNMCRKYKQESVYVKIPGEAPKYLDPDGNQVNLFSSDNYKFNRPQEQFYTTTKRDKTDPQRFTADIVFESAYVPLRPASYNEKMRRVSIGEYIL